MMRVIQFLLRLLKIPACSLFLGNLHILESIFILNGFSAMMIFFIVIYLIIYAKKAEIKLDVSEKAKLMREHLHYLELALGFFSFSTIMIGYYLEGENRPHDLIYYWGYFANATIFVTCEALSRMDTDQNKDATSQKKDLTGLGPPPKRGSPKRIKSQTPNTSKRAKLLKSLRPKPPFDGLDNPSIDKD